MDSSARALRGGVALAVALFVVGACSSSSSGPPAPGSSDASTDATVEADASPEPVDASASVDAAVPTDASIDVEVEDAGVAPDADAATTQCNTLEQIGMPIGIVDRVASFDPAQLRDGALSDGRYVSSQATHYVEASHVDGVTNPYGRETLTLRRGVLDAVFEYPTGEVVRFEANIVVTGASLQMTPTCVFSSNPGVHLPELGDWAPLVHELGFYESTAAQITVWTPRGNHESVVRVFTKVD